MLNTMEAAMFEARGFDVRAIETVKVSPRDVIARASKRVGNQVVRAEALGRSPEDATRKLVAVVTRP